MTALPPRAKTASPASLDKGFAVTIMWRWVVIDCDSAEVRSPFAAATKEAGGPTGGLGILFIAAGLALAMVLGLVAVMGYFALKP